MQYTDKMEQLKRNGVKGVFLLFLWIILGTIGYVLIEHWNILDAFYMTIITISTVGFGEIHPLSNPGKIFTSVLIIVTLGTVFYVFTMFGQFFIEGEITGVFSRSRREKKMEKLKNHYIVCGYGRIGRNVVEGLKREEVPFIIIDSNNELRSEFEEKNYFYIIGDATEESILKMAGIERAKAVISLLPTDADNLYVAITTKGLNPDVKFITRAVDERAEIKMKKVGVDHVISPYKIAGSRILNSALKPTVVEFLELVTHREHIALSLEEVKIDKNSPLLHKTLSELDLRNKYGVIVIAIKKSNGEMIFNPDPHAKFEDGDTVVVLGKEEDLKKLQTA